MINPIKFNALIAADVVIRCWLRAPHYSAIIQIYILRVKSWPLYLGVFGGIRRNFSMYLTYSSSTGWLVQVSHHHVEVKYLKNTKMNEEEKICARNTLYKLKI